MLNYFKEKFKSHEINTKHYYLKYSSKLIETDDDIISDFEYQCNGQQCNFPDLILSKFNFSDNESRNINDIIKVIEQKQSYYEPYNKNSIIIKNKNDTIKIKNKNLSKYNVVEKKAAINKYNVVEVDINKYNKIKSKIIKNNILFMNP